VDKPAEPVWAVSVAFWPKSSHSLRLAIIKWIPVVILFDMFILFVVYIALVDGAQSKRAPDPKGEFQCLKEYLPR
jgi:hypothetical protein